MSTDCDEQLRNLHELARDGSGHDLERVLKSTVSLKGGQAELSELIKNQDSDGVTIVHIAAERGDVDLLEKLVQLTGSAKGIVDVLDARGGQPILEASASGKLECIQWLVDKGADLNAADNRGDTALHLAAGLGHIQVMKWLIKHGAVVDAKTKISVTPLLYATAKGCVKAVDLLVQHGANVEAQDEERGWNALHTASGCNQATMLEWLASKYPNLVLSKTRNGRSLKEVAQEEKCPNTFLLCMQLEKDTQKLRRRQRILEERKKQAAEEARARQLAIEEADRLEKELAALPEQKEKKSKKKKRKSKVARKEESEAVVKSASPSTNQIEQQGQDEVPETTAPGTEEQGDVPSTKKEKVTRSSIEGQDIDERQKEDACWVIKLSKREKKRLRANRSASFESGSTRSDDSGNQQESSSSDHSSAGNQEKEPEKRKKEKAKPKIDLRNLESNAEEKSAEPVTIAPVTAASAEASPAAPPPTFVLSPTKRKMNRWQLGNPFKNATSSSESSGHTPTAAERKETINMNNSNNNMAESGSPVLLAPASSSGEATDGSASNGSKLRPHAPPWSPRRRRWTSPAANAGQVKTKVFVEHSPEVVDNEFQRMLKKFVHMDTGARRAAKQKFAKQTAEYEEKRLADAEKMENSWRASVRSKLRRGIEAYNFKLLEQVLEEIKAAEEARLLHEDSNSSSRSSTGSEGANQPNQDDDEEQKEDQDASSSKKNSRRINNEEGESRSSSSSEESEEATNGSILKEDPEIAELVKQGREVMAKKDKAPLQSVARAWRNGVLVLVPSSNKETAQEFEVRLRHSVEVWRYCGNYKRVWVRFYSEQSHFIPVAVNVGFDFEHARPGYVIMSCSLSSEPTTNEEGTSSTSDQDFTVKVVLLKTSPQNGKASEVLLAKRHETDEWELPWQHVLTGEDPLMVAETFVREVSGFAVSLQILDNDDNASNNSSTFLCTVCVNDNEEQTFNNSHMESNNVAWHTINVASELLDEQPDIDLCQKLAGNK